MSRFVRFALVVFFCSLSSAFALSPLDPSAALPLAFEGNEGQVSPQYSYVLRHDGMEARFFQDGIDFSLPGQTKEGERLRLEFVSADRNAAPTAEDLLKGRTHYLLGSDSSRWIQNVPNYARVRYRDVYPGISLVFYGTGSELEHDFIVAAGADPSSIAFQLQGARKIYLSPDGDLEVHMGAGTLILRKPVAYQRSARGSAPVDANFLLEANGTVRFRLGTYDSNRALVIDPVFSFSTYLSGGGIDQITSATTDTGGNIYLTGTTNSVDFPLQNAEQTQLRCNPSSGAGCHNSFVTKLDPTGKLIYSTYLGGSLKDDAASIAVDINGNAIVAGVTLSSDFPHAGSVPSVSCQINAPCYFVASLKPDGSALNYSGTIGGSGLLSTNGGSGRLAVDATGNAYLTGNTDSQTFQLTSGTIETTTNGQPYETIFVLKVDPTGKLIYSTAISGDPQLMSIGTDFFLPAGISVDATGQVIVAGTAGPGLRTTSGVIATAFPNNPSVPNATAGFVLQLNASGLATNYASYIPGTHTLGGMAVDKNGNIYITGGTSESTLPVSANAYQKQLTTVQNCTCDVGFIAKLNPQVTSVLAASYLSGTPSIQSPDISFTGIALDSHSNVFVGGMTAASDFPLQNPFVAQFENTSWTREMVLAEMSPDLSSLIFGSFLSSTDSKNDSLPGSTFSALTIDPNDNLIVAGTTNADHFPTTAGSLEPHPPAQTGLFAGAHSFVSKIDMAAPAPSFCADTWIVDFGLAPALVPSARTFNITNCGNASLNLSAITSTAPSFTASQNCGPIAPGASCSVTITFTPADSSPVSGSISFADNAVISSQSVQVTGQGQAPDLEPVSKSIPFGHLLSGTVGPKITEILKNQGNAPLIINDVSISGDGFSVSQNGCIGTWPANSFCFIVLTFSPSAVGALSGSLVISSNDPVHPQLAVNLSGMGDSAYAAPALTGSEGTTALPQQTVQINNGPVLLYVSGSNFYPASVVQVNGVAQQTTFISNSILQVTIAASSLTALGELPLTVVNPGPGGGTSTAIALTPYQVLPLAPSFVVSVPATKLLYAAIPASSASNPNTVVPIDPATGTAATPIPVGNNPGKMAASSDGAYLYVALIGDQTVQRIDLKTNSVDRTFPYSPNPFCTNCGVLSATDLEAVPGSPQEVVLAQGSMASLYNDSGLVNYVPNAFVPYFAPTFASIAFAGNPLTLYALPFTSVQDSFFTIASIGDAGLQYTQISGANYGGNNTTGTQVASDGALLYTSAGEVWNPATQSQVGTFPVSTFNPSFALDNTLQQIYVIGGQNYGTNSSAIVLSSYGMQSLALQNTLGFPQINSFAATNIVRWGSNGFGFVSSGGLYLMRSAIAQQMPNPTPKLTSISPIATISRTSPLTLTITGSGFVPSSIVSLNLMNPLVTSYVSSTQLTATIPTANLATSGEATVTVATPEPGGGITSPIFFTVYPANSPLVPSSTSLSFLNVTEGNSSPEQTITLSNFGTATLSIASIAATGDFTETNTCGTTLPANGSCQISVIFTPTGAGQRTGSLAITNSTVVNPLAIILSGRGVPPVTIGAASGGSTSATVSSGGDGTYNLSLVGSTDFNGTVTLTCSGAPANASCTINPTTLNLTPGRAANFTVTVRTAAPQAAFLVQDSTIRLAGFGVGLLFTLPLFFFQFRRRIHLVSLRLAATCVLLTVAGCAGNGNGSGPTSTNPSATPAGTYTLTVTASTGSQTTTQKLMLIVQ